MQHSFFTDFEPIKDVRIAVSSLVGDISPHISSQRGAWASITKDQLLEAGYTDVTILYKNLNQDWEWYDIVIIDHWVETKGKINFYKGFDSKVFYQINRLFTSGIRIYSLRFDMPCVASEVLGVSRTRLGEFSTILDRIDDLFEACNNIPRIDFIEKCSHQVLGDTHAGMVYRPKSNIVAESQLSMKSMLSKGVGSYLLPWAESLTICVGHTDVRHLLMRDQNPIKSIDSMVSELESQLKATGLMDVSIRQVLPVEKDGRKIPPSSRHKGHSYFGTWKERLALSRYLNVRIEEICENNWWGCIKNPSGITEPDGSLSWKCMEQFYDSEYLSREHFLWNFEKRSRNFLF